MMGKKQKQSRHLVVGKVRGAQLDEKHWKRRQETIYARKEVIETHSVRGKLSTVELSNRES